jgi:EAL domain-containing protein (putative c-di-GMP-specific phosphodiesterase class I)
MSTPSATESAQPGKIVVFGEDHQFLETMHVCASALRYDWIVANTVERLMELAALPVAGVVIDLQARGPQAPEALRALANLPVLPRIILLTGSDMRSWSAAKRECEALSIELAGTLPRPLKMNLVLKLLAGEIRAPSELTADDLGKALTSRELVLHYQPIVSRTPEGWRTTGAEALIRWQHPERGLIYPGQFLKIAEGHGLMPELNRFVMTEAIRQAAEWKRSGLDLIVSINLPPSLLRTGRLADELSQLLGQHDVAPDQVMLELIEAGSLTEREQLQEMLTRLRMRGMGLSLDDFGTGYSSLTELCTLPFSNLKIDRQLTSQVPQAHIACTIVQGVVDLAHRLSIRVCAEAVETDEAFEFLDKAGCDQMQGTLISNAVAAHELEQWMAARGEVRGHTAKLPQLKIG